MFENIKFNYDNTIAQDGKSTYLINEVYWSCPSCGSAFTQHEMRLANQKWIAHNPDAYKAGVCSFKINSFSSPWYDWAKICKEFLEAKDDPSKLQPFFNTVLGECFEDREKIEDPDILYKRRETYDAELPDGVLALTMGVDTQDNRLEYEVVGYGRYGESWGIEKGYIMGKPDTEEVWNKLDAVIDHLYEFKNGKKLKISITFIDSGGHYTQEVYKNCFKRKTKKVFAIKGKGGADIPYTSPPSTIYIDGGNKKKHKNNKTIFLCVLAYF